MDKTYQKYTDKMEIVAVSGDLVLDSMEDAQDHGGKQQNDGLEGGQTRRMNACHEKNASDNSEILSYYYRAPASCFGHNDENQYV